MSYFDRSSWWAGGCRALREDMGSIQRYQPKADSRRCRLCNAVNNATHTRSSWMISLL